MTANATFSMSSAQQNVPVSVAIEDQSDPALVLTLGELHELSALLGLNIDSAPQLIQRVRQMRDISVEGVNITLEPGLVTRLKSRCLKKDGFADYLTAEIKRLLHGAVGW